MEKIKPLLPEFGFGNFREHKVNIEHFLAVNPYTPLITSGCQCTIFRRRVKTALKDEPGNGTVLKIIHSKITNSAAYYHPISFRTDTQKTAQTLVRTALLKN
jgi:hypothetical protein